MFTITSLPMQGAIVTDSVLSIAKDFTSYFCVKVSKENENAKRFVIFQCHATVAFRLTAYAKHIN